MTPSDITATARKRLIAELQAMGIKDKKVLDAMGKISREAFLAPAFKVDAYTNSALPIGENQTISQPYIVAVMTQALDIQPQHKILEIGTGCGYQTSVLCQFVRRVFTIERFASLSQGAEKTLHSLGIYNFSTKVGDGSLGWAEQAPFDRIIVTAASPQPPKALLEQLKSDGILIIPIGSQNGAQKLMRYYKTADGNIEKQTLGEVRFVPLVGEQGVRLAVGG